LVGFFIGGWKRWTVRNFATACESSQHRYDNLSLVLAGRYNGAPRPAGILDLPADPLLANVHLTRLRRVSSSQTAFGDSTDLVPL